MGLAFNGHTPTSEFIRRGGDVRYPKVQEGGRRAQFDEEPSVVQPEEGEPRRIKSRDQLEAHHVPVEADRAIKVRGSLRDLVETSD